MPEILYHGTDGDFDTFNRDYAATAKHIYTTPQYEVAAQYGNRVLTFRGNIGRCFDMRPENLDVEQYQVLRRVFEEIGPDWCFEELDEFLEVVTDGKMYQFGGNQWFQNGVLDEIFSLGYDSVWMIDAGFGGAIAESVVFADPARLVRINRDDCPVLEAA